MVFNYMTKKASNKGESNSPGKHFRTWKKGAERKDRMANRNKRSQQRGLCKQKASQRRPEVCPSTRDTTIHD